MKGGVVLISSSFSIDPKFMKINNLKQLTSVSLLGCLLFFFLILNEGRVVTVKNLVK